MKPVKIIQLLMLILLISNTTWAQKPENWTSRQLIEPSELAQVLQSGKDLPVIISVGPGATIPHSIDIRMVKEQENLKKFKKELSTVPKETKIVIYCGCCPFDHCPNVRPAIAVLNDMKFTTYQLLNLPNNIKADWIDKGYPVSKQ
ncbi:MAG TPA: hypothetical protein VKA92_09555 [Segetibacter sp.]|nr:hypothetical protein [Segetibacter sp.]